MLEELYLKNALIPKRYLTDPAEFIPSKLDKKCFKELQLIESDIKSFVDNGNNLLIYSENFGNGKTTWSIKLLKAYIKAVGNYSFTYSTPAIFININNFINEKKLSINDKNLEEKVRDIERKILSAKLVVFDDIGDKTLSEYDKSLMYYWIEYRTANMKSSIYTTNQSLDELENSLGGKTYSRVVNYSIVKEFVSRLDRRSGGDE